MAKKWYYWLGALLVLFLTYKGYGATTKRIKRSKDFSLEKISSQEVYKLSGPLPITPDEIARANHILDQPFFFLGRGRQCYAFLSVDGQYVLKFFQQDRFLVNTYVSFFPDCFLAKKLQKQKAKLKKNKRQKMLLSFELAKRSAESETSVFFVHLNPTENQYKEVTLLDPRGTLFSIPLDKVQFALQRRAKLLKPTLVTLMHEGREDEAKRRIEQIFEMFVSCGKKGIEDHDGALIRNDNLGFLEDRAIYIDIGKLSCTGRPATKAGFVHDLRRLHPLNNWLEKNYPPLAAHFQKCQAQAIELFND